MNSKRKPICALAMLTASAILMNAATAAVGWGDSGDTVKRVQQKLINWGYMSGSADGKYGAQTEKAVREFQKKNGIEQTGVAGDKTLAALGITGTQNAQQSSGGTSTQSQKKNASGSGEKSNSGDVNLLARCIYGEARGEPYKGKVAIGAVILNRVKSADFPNTIAGVIYQPGAFSVVSDGQINLSPDAECLRAARDAMNGHDPTGGCTFYFNPGKTSNKYMHSKKIVTTIGGHVFSM